MSDLPMPPSKDLKLQLPVVKDSHPWVGVHELTEFVFCPRAGLLFHRESTNDTGQELDHFPRLDFLPDFDTAEIQEQLKAIGQQSEKFLVGSFVGGFCLLLFAAFVDWRPVSAIALGYMFPLRWYFQQIRICELLDDRLKQSQQSPASEPSIPLKRRCPINWWSLLNAGLTPVRYEEPHRDLNACLSGRPWRILQRGSYRIPVFRKRSGPPELFEQHFVRMTAYCHVVEECELAEVPYAVVLFGDGYEGVAIPNQPEDLSQFLEAVEYARRVLTEFEKLAYTPQPPVQESICRNCHWGLPTRIASRRMSAVRRGTVTEFLTEGVDGKLYHSPCGDLFRWVPPSERARELKLM